MKTPKKILTLTCAAALATSVTACGAAAAVLAVRSLPDLARYLQIRSM